MKELIARLRYPVLCTLDDRLEAADALERLTAERDALKAALNHVPGVRKMVGDTYNEPQMNEAITALRAALAQPEQEPVAYLTRWTATKNEPIDANPWVVVEARNYTPNPGKDSLPLYLHPAHDDTAPKLPFPEADLTGVSVCCGDYQNCGRPCTPRGRWQASIDDTALRDALSYARGWISSTPHGDNCFVSDHYEGDPGNRCNCGKDSAINAIDNAEELTATDDTALLRQCLAALYADPHTSDWDDAVAALRERLEK